jgi:hypothetical protein
LRPSFWQLDTFRNAFAAIQHDYLSWWKQSLLPDHIAFFAGILFVIAAIYLLPYFVILPFGARPGLHKPCVRHVTRTILLGSGMIHWWGAAYVITFLLFAATGVSTNLGADYATILSPLLGLFTFLSFWTLLVLVLAVRHEYRGPADFPEPHDPWCDDCGYNLTGIDPAGRCPECGRLIADSIGPHNRPPTPWERHPRFRNLRLVASQAIAVIHHPRAFFFSMPTLTGQPAAHRWLLASALVLFLTALPIVPVLYITFDAEWNFAIIPSSLAMALTWVVFGLMMVGIETAGIATFSRLRGQRTYLATSAKITAYSAFLMIPWVILGGAQLIAYTYLASQHPNGVQRLFNVGMRGEQIALAVSLAIAHIGGLLWYELTVYRGIRAIEYANK